MSLITLTTDFGTKEGNTTAMKGVLYTLMPNVRILDIAHEIQSQNLYGTAFVLEINAFFFPTETVHIVVVDPGVGAARRAVAGRLGDQFFVGPDNGVLTRVLLRAKTCLPRLCKPTTRLTGAARSAAPSTGAAFLPPLGRTWPEAPLSALGPLLSNLVRLTMQMPQREQQCVTGEVILIDHFGNAITNLRAGELAGLEDIDVNAAGKTIPGLSTTLSSQPAGTLLALWGSSGYVMIIEYGGL